MLTDQQREQLATLAVGDTTVLVDEVNLPEGIFWIRQHFYDPSRWIDGDGGSDYETAPPHGKVGDEFTATIRDESLSPGDWHGQSYEGTFRVKSEEVMEVCDGCGGTMTEQEIIDHPTAISCCPDRRMRLAWLTEVERIR